MHEAVGKEIDTILTIIKQEKGIPKSYIIETALWEYLKKNHADVLEKMKAVVEIKDNKILHEGVVESFDAKKESEGDDGKKTDEKKESGN